jgi:hypothetical protein
MSDEMKSISIQVPAEYLKKADSVVSENVKIEDKSEENKSVTLQASPEQLRLLTALRQDFESYQRSQVDDSYKTLDRLIRATEMRISFYEKLILLAGSSIALSLTFLASLQKNVHQGNFVVAFGRLKAAWILLLASTVLGWLHNFYRCAVVDHALAASSTFATSVQHTLASNLAIRASGLFKGMESPPMGLSDFMALCSKTLKELSEKTRDGGEGYIKGLKRFHIVSSILGFIALLSVIVAFWFMIQFAVRNVGLL